MAESGGYSGNWVQILADLAGSYFGFKEAQDRSKNTMTPKNAFMVGNPNYSNPFQSRTTDWNGGDPSVRQEFSPAVMELINEWVGRSEKAGQGRTPYGMSEGMRGTANAQQNWQRERFGLDPMSQPEEYTPYEESGDSSRVIDELASQITAPQDWASQEDEEEQPFDLTGLPPDFLNDKGNIRRKYRPDNKWFVGDEEMRRWAEDPNYQGAVFPDDYRNDKGNIRRRYRGQEYYSNPQNPDVAVFGTGTGAPEDWLNDKGNIRRRYREGANQYGGTEFQSPDWIQPEDWLNDKGNVRRKYRTGG